MENGIERLSLIFPDNYRKNLEENDVKILKTATYFDFTRGQLFNM